MQPSTNNCSLTTNTYKLPAQSAADRWGSDIKQVTIKRVSTCLPDTKDLPISRPLTDPELASLLRTEHCANWCHGFVIKVTGDVVEIDCDCNARAEMRSGRWLGPNDTVVTD